MTLKDLDDIIQLQKDCQEEMKEKISQLESRNQEVLKDIHEAIWNEEEEE